MSTEANEKVDRSVPTTKPCCPRCRSESISTDMVEWDAVSRDDPENKPLLMEHQCRDCGIAFWTGEDELTEVVEKVPAKKPLRCDWRKECENRVTHIGEKGYVYCEADAHHRSGTERVRELSVRERETLERGERVNWTKKAP